MYLYFCEFEEPQWFLPIEQPMVAGKKTEGRGEHTQNTHSAGTTSAQEFRIQSLLHSLAWAKPALAGTQEV